MVFPAVLSARIRLVLVCLVALIGGCHPESNAAQAPPVQAASKSPIDSVMSKADSGKPAAPGALKSPATAPPQSASSSTPKPRSAAALKATSKTPRAPSAKPTIMGVAPPTAGKPIAAAPAATKTAAANPVEAKPAAPIGESPFAPKTIQPTAQPQASGNPLWQMAAKADTLPAPLRELGQNALKVPEKLLFDIIWGGWSFKWVTAGQATLELHATDNPNEWQIRSLAWANGFFQSMYPVKDTVISLIDSRGIYPVRFEKHLNEGSYHADIAAQYDQVAHTLKTEDTTLTIEPFTHDVLSAFYYIRTQKLVVGDTLDLAAVSGKKKYSLKVLCHGRETITVPAGEFHTLVVEPVLKGDGLFKAKGKLTIWVTDDEFHIPVKMVSKIPVGSIKAELVSKS